jgi:ribosomal protein L7/L12
MDDAVQTVIIQCELWTDNYDMEEEHKVYSYSMPIDERLSMVADDIGKYN